MWSLIGAILSQGSSVAVSVIVARLLGKEQFGKYGMIQSTVGMLGTFAGMGLGVTTTKYVAALRTLDKTRAGRIIALGWTAATILGGTLSVGLLAFASPLAARTLNDPNLAGALRISSVLLFLNAFNGAQIGALAGFEAFEVIARINLVRGMIGIPFTLLYVYLWGVDGAIWALAVTAGATCFVSQVSLHRKCAALGIKSRLSDGWRERRVLWTFSMPAFLSGALVGPVIWIANTILVNRPSGYAEMGVLSAATQWRNAIGFIPGVLGQFALPLLANLNGERDVVRYSKALRWNLILTVVAASAAAVPVVIGASQIMRLYGSGFQRGRWVLVISAVTAVISSANSVVGTAITSSGYVWVGFAFNAMWAVVFLVGCLYLVPAHLSLGFACSMLGAYVAHTIWQALYVRKRLVHV